MTVTIYHNPRCSKSRAALELLRSRGFEPMIVEYLKNPPSASELRRILNKLGMDPRELMRRDEAPYKINRLDNHRLTRVDLFLKLLEIPIVYDRQLVLRWIFHFCGCGGFGGGGGRGGRLL